MPRPVYLFDARKIAKMQNAGMRPQEIADAYGCDRSSLYYWARKTGFTLSHRMVDLTDEEVDMAIERHVSTRAKQSRINRLRGKRNNSYKRAAE